MVMGVIWRPHSRVPDTLCLETCTGQGYDGLRLEIVVKAEGLS